MKSKLIVFEGVSGSGKTSIIDSYLKHRDSKDNIITNWFSLNSIKEISGKIDNYVTMSADYYSLIYALEFYARLELQILPELNRDNNVISHRYIYTPLSHDSVRGSSEKLLNMLYTESFILNPNIIFFMDTKPLTAYERIIHYRIPTFFECGLDIEYSNHLNEGLKRFKNGFFNSDELRERYLYFQNQVYTKYQKILPNDTIYIDENKTLSEQLNYIMNYL
ncbi:hypothetical protein CIW83_05505 [Tissierella sp. P1]|uniref:dTMP kinase n=1 Tax=Tissierella sp. P1 TaxID=1280483 RepID=UPI000BA10119|nr:hypothetical protein [Tissierella sp. P1]OZV13003.1 hypothetical protein CIW83_05505 [Tissierella sp. P1]